MYTKPNTTITAKEIKPGMVVDIYGASVRVAVEAVEINEFGAVFISNGVKWYGLGVIEKVTFKGQFNL